MNKEMYLIVLKDSDLNGAFSQEMISLNLYSQVKLANIFQI